MAHTPWHGRPFLAVDTETTGVDPFTDRIVELAAVVVDQAGVVGATMRTVVNPGVDVPDEAAAIHGITTERAATEGCEPAEALGLLARILAENPDMPVVIYNASFDWPLIMAEAARAGVDLPAVAGLLDPYLIDRKVDRYRKGGRKLTAVAAHYGVELGEAAHGAQADATAAGRVMRCLIEKYPEAMVPTLAGMWLRQVRWAEEDRLSFVDYQRRTNDPTFDKPAGWPIPVASEAAA